jgi:hypothetical protein
MKSEDAPQGDRRTLFQRLVKRREAGDRSRGKEQRQSLEGLRLATLMKQMQALQAIQGLQELAPKKENQGRRYEPSTDPEERVRQRQWLEFKADWLQAVLEDTLSELEALDRFERELNALPGAASRNSKKTAADAGGDR